MESKRAKRIAVAGVVVVGATAAVAASLRQVAGEVAQPFVQASAAYVRSETCATCHPFRHATWEDTFHRSMTQAPSPSAVLGDFDEASYTYRGVTSRFTHEGGRYVIETLDAEEPSSGRLRRYEVALTVGSRRVQQYVTRIGDRHIRLPLAWNVEERRWFHLAAGFLHPDGSDFHTHTSVWDTNCIFCHNVKAMPRFDPVRETFDSRVEELGIACEACHGPGSEHEARSRNPLRRYWLHVRGDADPTMVSPHELSPERQVQLCGHCHGQRLPNPRSRIQEFVTKGDPYTAGEDLSLYTAPIWHDTKLEGADFSLRFWGDGTPRLTAYEYQALLMTRDYREGGLTCVSCHTMHGGDPRGMITVGMRGKAACIGCHAKIGSDVAAHTRHRADGPGSDCYACHMPRITYGIVDVHPTHRIQNPDPSRAWRYEMPEACTLCHVDRTAEWAATALSKSFELPAPELPGGDFHDVAECVRALLAGDVVQRAVAAMALSDSTEYADTGSRLWAVPFLLLTMEDGYPAIRHFAHRGLRRILERSGSLPPAIEFDPLAEEGARSVALQEWWTWWEHRDKSDVTLPGEAVPLTADFRPLEAVVSRLKAERDDRIIAIGE